MNGIKGLMVILGLFLAVSAQAHEKPTHHVPEAPPEYLNKKNPLSYETLEKRAVRRAARMYKSKCKKCHGSEGDGHGPRFGELSIHPAPFSDPGYLKDRADGQLFWIIENGSPGTEMPAHGPGSRFNLSHDEIWKLILHLRANFMWGGLLKIKEKM